MITYSAQKCEYDVHLDALDNLLPNITIIVFIQLIKFFLCVISSVRNLTKAELKRLQVRLGNLDLKYFVISSRHRFFTM